MESRGGVDSKISTEVWGMGGRGCIILILDGVSFDLASFINQTFRKWGGAIKFSAMRSQAIHQSLVSHFQLFGVKRSQHFSWYGVRLPLSLRSSLPSMQGALGSSHLKTCRTYRPSLGDFHFCMPYHSVVKQA